jgi:hypothetical protein
MTDDVASVARGCVGMLSCWLLVLKVVRLIIHYCYLGDGMAEASVVLSQEKSRQCSAGQSP